MYSLNLETNFGDILSEPVTFSAWQYALVFSWKEKENI